MAARRFRAMWRFDSFDKGRAIPSPMQPTLILASASPRRQSLLREAGYEFVVHPADIDEDAITRSASLTPEALARHLALLKTEKIADQFPDDVVLAADTVVAVGKQLLGKADDANDARRILTTLSGTNHKVITGVSLVRRRPELQLGQTVTSLVQMHVLNPAQIDRYIATNLWQCKAGAYGLQDPHGFVQSTQGCSTNIVGLPMTTTVKLLEQAGIRALNY
jgi:septum formation protein